MSELASESFNTGGAVYCGARSGASTTESRP
jgi:hypothetical protein